MKKNLLKKFHEYFKKNEGRINHYAIPDLWQVWGYDNDSASLTTDGQVITDPDHFFKTLIEEVFLKDAPNTIASLSMQHNLNTSGDWLKDSAIYSSLIRTSSAWDHDRSGFLENSNRDGIKETGTFLKTLALLPFLKKMGINALYLLPIMTFSKSHKKGDMGSPYGVQDFFALDEALQDDLTKDAFTIDEEFRLLVEAAHSLDMRVLIDIIPRTNAIDSHFIKEHPEWFYWVKADQLNDYGPPYIEGIPSTTTPKEKYMKKVYENKNIYKHIDKFDFDPKTKDPELYEKIKDSDNLLDAIEKHYNLTVAPAFSDHINDAQPPWTDITFFRLFFDHPSVAKPYIKKDTPPYILFDSIKCNLYPGQKPNKELWKTIANIIPYYQKTFGIDGARIDMGHALPKDLLAMIIQNARAVDPDFGFIAEELDNANAQDAKDKGYNMIIGNGFFAQPRVFDGSAKKFFYQAADLELPLFAAPETHDTPRIAARDGKEALSKTLAVLNMFTPNGVPFINSGLEIFESQAMNLGLDSTPLEAKRLSYNDPFFGKLALFDRYQLHYTYELRYVIPAILNQVNPIREKLKPALFDRKKLHTYESDNPFFVGLIYMQGKKITMVFGNLNPFHVEQAHIDITPIRRKTKNTKTKGKLLFSTHEAPRLFAQFVSEDVIDIHLGPGEVKIVEL